MLDSIRVALSGLLGYARGLKTVGQNTDNLNTTAYKSALLQFRERVFGGLGNPMPGTNGAPGQGVDSFSVARNFSAGESQSTNNPLDLMINGDGWFVMRDAAGQIFYTRAGEFAFDASGKLVDRSDGAQVQALDAKGQLTSVMLDGFRTQAASATTILRFGGNISSTQASVDLDSLKVIDTAGATHTLSMSLQPDDLNRWQMRVSEGSTMIGTATLNFDDGKPTESSRQLSLNYTPPGRSTQALTFDFSSDVTAFAADSLSTLALIDQNGVAPGALTTTTFDGDGYLALRYDNGTSVKGPRLALARFDSPAAAIALGGARFKAAEGQPWQVGAANEGAFGGVLAQALERSNVDLTQSLSELVILQRGYQGSSQVLSTANDLLQTLFDMGSKR